MDNNNLLMIVLAFVVGYCLKGMMKNMCGSRLLEGKNHCDDPGNCPECDKDEDCEDGASCTVIMGVKKCIKPYPHVDLFKSTKLTKFNTCMSNIGSWTTHSKNQGDINYYLINKIECIDDYIDPTT
jgi:hypothetical protein